MLDFRAVNDYVYLEILEKDEKQLQSGIILTGDAVDDYMKNTRRGRVLSIGEAVTIPGLEIGQTIWFSRFVGTEIGEDRIVVKQEHLLGIE